MRSRKPFLWTIQYLYFWPISHLLYSHCRRSSKYLLHSNHTRQFDVYPKSGSGSRNCRVKFGRISMQISINCTFSPFVHSFACLILSCARTIVSYVPDATHPIKPAQISAACLVADVLGPEVRTHYISRYVSLELKEYRRIFRATDEAGGLDNISRRFAWFRRLLAGHEAEAERVFPSEWNVGWELFAKFVEITRWVRPVAVRHWILMALCTSEMISRPYYPKPDLL